MAWDGWLSFGGTEIINAPRTMAYVRHVSPRVDLRDPCSGDCSCDYLPAMLQTKEYASPLADEAPWVDMDRPESYDFLGAYPLEVRGIDDDTAEAEVVRALGDGGWVTNTRRGVKEVYVEAALISVNDEADHYGISWLKSALEGSCTQGCRPSDRLCFLTACVDPSGYESMARTMEMSVEDFQTQKRHIARWDRSQLWLDNTDAWVEFNADPLCSEIDWEFTLDGEPGQVIRFTRSDGTYKDVTLTGVAQSVTVWTDDETLKVSAVDDAGLGWPVKVWIHRLAMYGRVEASFDDCTFEFFRNLRRVARTEGPVTLRVDHLSDGLVVRTVRFIFTAEVPYVFSEGLSVASLSPNVVTALPSYRAWRLDENIGECEVPPTRVIVDPSLPLQPPKPPPSLAASSPTTTPPGQRPYGVVIPATRVFEWSDVIPTVSISATEVDLYNVRVRFFPMPFDHTQPEDLDLCSQCGAFEIGYIKKGYTMRVCACSMDATTGAIGEELTIPANHLLHADRHIGRLEWPALSCGSGYMMIVDTRDKACEIDLTLAVRE
jgi:hypothetical protein